MPKRLELAANAAIGAPHPDDARLLNSPMPTHSWTEINAAVDTLHKATTLRRQSQTQGIRPRGHDGQQSVEDGLNERTNGRAALSTSGGR